MDPLTPIKRFDAFQQRHKPLAIPVAVIKKSGNDQAGNLAALVAYYAFFSIFPLLLVFVTILGFVLHGHHHELASIENSVGKNFPEFAGPNGVIQFNSIKGSGAALIIGVVTSLWSGLGVTGAAQNALDTVWAVPKKSRPNFLQSKARGVLLLVSLGVLFIVATLLSGIVTGGFGGAVTKVLGIAVSFLANVVLFAFAFRFMTAKTVPSRDLRSGVVVAAVFWTALQVLGGLYVKHVLGGLTSTYGQFALIIGLLVWFHLGAQLTLYAAELNTVLERHLYPRSLLGPPDEPADQRTLAALAKAEESNDIQHVEVSFSEPEPEPEPDGGAAPQAAGARVSQPSQAESAS
jgi:YihY family inner membrane protein